MTTLSKSLENANSLKDLLEKNAAIHPDKIAFSYLQDGEGTEQNLSYGQLWREAQSIAGYLQGKSLNNERALLFFPPGLEYFKAYFGAILAGLTVVSAFPPDPTALDKTLMPFINTFKDAKPKVVLTNQMILQMSSMFVAMAPELQEAEWIALDALDRDYASEWKPVKRPNNAPVFLQYTSGSTGSPKGVMYSEENLIFEMKAIKRLMSHLEDFRGVSWVPQYHSFGIGAALTSLIFGGHTVLLSPKDFLAKPIRWLQAISRYRANFSPAPNFAMDLAADNSRSEEVQSLDLSSWSVLLLGGEAVKSSSVNRFMDAFGPAGFRREAITPSFGITEASLGVSIAQPRTEPHILSLDTEAMNSGALRLTEDNSSGSKDLFGCGKAFEGVIAKIVDPTNLRETLPGQIGEIWLSGPNIALGYWGQPELSRETFQNRLNGDQNHSYFRTGDLGFLHGEEIYVTGRIKDLIIIRGKNHYPLDLEQTVADSHPALRAEACAAIGIEAQEEERVVILQELGTEHLHEKETIVESIKGALASKHGIVPSAICLLERASLPKTRTGKLQHQACKNAYLEKSLPMLFSKQEADEETEKIQGPGKLDLQGLNAGKLEAWLLSFVAYLTRNKSSIDPLKKPASLGLDSLRTVQLARRLESELGILVPIASLFEAENLKSFSESLFARFEERQRETSGPSVEELMASEHLPEDITILKLDENTPTLHNSFLTGATGFLGAFLLHELLEQSQDRVYCLVRAKTFEDGLRRVTDNLIGFGLWNDGYRDRVVPVLGDLSRPNFGLAPEDYRVLSESIDKVFHNAAIVNFIYGYHDLRGANVEGTIEAIRFCNRGKAKHLHYVSSLSVFPFTGSPENRPYNESEEPQLSNGLLNGYAQSKWVADKLVREAIRRGACATIYRPGEVIGHSQTGACHAQKDAYSLMIQGAIELKTAPQLNLNINVVPVDYVTKAIVRISKLKEAEGKVYHLTNPQSFPITELYSYVKSLGYSLEVMKLQDWQTNLHEAAKEQPENGLVSFIPFFESHSIQALAQAKTRFDIDCSNALEALEGSPVNCATQPEALFRPYLAFLQKSGFIRPLAQNHA